MSAISLLRRCFAALFRADAQEGDDPGAPASRIEELADPAQLYGALWESTTDAVVVIDGDNRIRHANRALREVLGHEPEQVLGQDLGLLQPERLRERHRDAMNRYLRTHQRTRDWRAFESAGLHRDGHEVPLEISFSEVPAGQGVLLAGFLRDVSARKRAEQALKLSEARLKLSVEAAGMGVWDWDIEQDQLQGCRVARAALGVRTRRPLPLSGLLERLHPEDRASVEAALRQALEQRDTFRFEARVRAAEPGERWVMARGRVNAVRDGRPSRMMGVVVDITERKVLERMRLEVEARLREKQKLQAIGTLAGGIAHDFNNVLAAILGNAAIALDELPPPHPAHQGLQQIQRSGLRARALVRQILAFSRGNPVSLAPQALAPVVIETTALLRATLPAGVKLEHRLAAEPVCAVVDGTEIERVLMNLCTNAWHALQGRPGTITVGLDVAAPRAPGHPPDGPRAHLWVQDDGCGMEAELRDRIFEPFFTTKEQGVGTGLGLSVVHGIVASHQGFLAVDTEKGRGSTFHVYLPLAAGGLLAQPDAADPAPPALRRLGCGERVLYIDDDEVMRTMVEALLQRCGFEVSCADGGEAALALMNGQGVRFHAVVCDFNMPGLSGIEVAQEIRRTQPQLPIVLSSGGLTAEAVALAGAARITAFMRKEDTTEALPGILRSLIVPHDGPGRAQGGTDGG